MKNADYEVIARASVVVTATSERLLIVLLCCGDTSSAIVKVSVQDQGRKALEVTEATRVMAPLPPTSDRLEVESLKRPIAALGNRNLRVGKLNMAIPLSARRWSRLAIRVTTTVEGSAEPQKFYVERSKRSWGLAAQPGEVGYAFLLTDQQIEERVNWLASTYGLARTHFEERVDALSALFLKLRGGFDSPLLGKELNDD